MNLNIVSTRCILLFLLVVLTGIQSRSLKKRSGIDCAPKVVKRKVAVATCYERKDIPVKVCEGTCQSYTIPSISGGGVTKLCECCRTLKEEIVTVHLQCRDNNGKIVVKSHDIISAKSCSCLPCI